MWFLWIPTMIKNYFLFSRARTPFDWYLNIYTTTTAAAADARCKSNKVQKKKLKNNGGKLILILLILIYAVLGDVFRGTQTLTPRDYDHLQNTTTTTTTTIAVVVNIRST